MKIKLDENMPLGLVTDLAAAGHDTDTVMDEGLAGRPDTEVWEASREAGRLLITQDLDFSDIRRSSREHTMGFSWSGSGSPVAWR